jgi:hypothetical protein
MASRRYHSFTDYDYSYADVKRDMKFILLLLVLRELPLKNFYARSAIVFFVIYYYAHHNWKTIPWFGYTSKEDLPLYYPSKLDLNLFENYPLLQNYLSRKRVTKIDSPGATESELWNINQFQPHYMHHFKHYRYIFRNRRVVPWDGTFNQPIYPYLNNNDRSAFVHNGLNEIRENNLNPAA